LAIHSQWIEIPPAPGKDSEQPLLRCWWSVPEQGRLGGSQGGLRGAVLVLPEVFGLNGWVRSVADRLAGEGYAALAMPIFERTAPGLELGYDAAGLAAGREHRDAVTAETFLADAQRAITWLQGQQLGQKPGLQIGLKIGCVGFCFGGHLALLAATLPAVRATCAFYGALVSSFRPGGGEPTLAVLPQIPGHLLCVCGDQDPLMPLEEQQAIAAALAADRLARQDQPGAPGERRLVVAQGAGHGFLCDARSDYNAEAAAMGWHEMVALFAKAL
jgi:carboxymethylenebutenolidase